MSVVANVAINVDSRNAVSKLRQVQTQSQATERAVEGLSRAFGGLAAAFGAGFALTKVIADVRELDTNLRRLGTVGVDVGKISPALSALSKELGGVASKAELAAASYQAASAGFSDTAGNINILRAATKAATGGLADTQAVTEVLVKTLNSYGLAGDQAAKVTDSISKAVELGNQEWSDYTSQLGRVASIAALAGVSLDEVNAFIASATKNGATAEVAFTGLGATLNTLLQPTKESQEAAAALGIAWNYGGLQAKGFTGLMAELAIAMEKDKETTAKLLGSQEAMRGAFAAAAKGGKDYKMVLDELSGAAGKTDADFQAMKGSLDNQLKALDTAFKNLSEALGIAFGPTVVKTISDVAAAVNIVADALNAIPQPAKTATAELIKLVAQIILLDKAIKAVIGLRVAFVAAMGGMTTATVASAGAAKTGAGAFALYANNTRIMQAQAAAATPALNGLLLTLRNLAAIGAIAIVVNVAVVGMAAVYQAQAEIDRLRGVRTKGGAAAAFGGSATAEQKKEQQAVLAAVKKERESAGFRGQQAAAAAGVGKTMARQRADQLAEREASARSILALPTRGAATPAANAMGTPIGATVGDDGAKSKGGADKAAREASRISEQIRASQARLTLAQDLFAIEGRLQQAQLAGNEELVIARNAQKELAELASQRADITADKEMPAAAKINELKKLDIAAATVSGKLAFDLAGLEQQRAKTVQDVADGLDMELLKLKAVTDVEKQALRMLEIENTLKQAGIVLTDEQRVKIGLQVQAVSNLEKAQAAAAESAKQLQDVYADIGMSIKSGIIDAIQGAVDGTKKLGEVAANVLNNIANRLLDVAINMALFGAMSGTGTGGGLLGGLFKKSANGNAFGANGIIPFAKGGIVNSPTLFPFAKGTGLMGEAGPEAIMPLQRGANGKLGVLATGGGGDVNVVVNVDASGSRVEGDEQEGKQLGRVIAAAIQQELVKQKRPGGLLA